MTATRTPSRSELRVVPLDEVPVFNSRRPCDPTFTISVGQPMSPVHQAAYDQGCYLLELDANEAPVRAYHRGTP